MLYDGVPTNDITRQRVALDPIRKTASSTAFKVTVVFVPSNVIPEANLTECDAVPDALVLMMLANLPAAGGVGHVATIGTVA